MRKFLTLTATAGLIAVCLVANGAGQGDIYRWKDPSGIWHYADQPVPGAELVKGTRRPPAAAPAPTAPTTAATDSNAAQAAKPEVADQVRQDVVAANADRCKKAEEIYARSVQARRMYKVDAQGVKTFLTDAELDETRLNARTQRDSACNP